MRIRVAMTILVLATGSCMSAPIVRTTFLGSVDLVEMTDRMAESFASDPLFAGRTDADETWVISVYRVVNHTNQIVPDREKWLYIGRLRAQLAQTDVAERYRLVWVIPPERWSMVAEELGTPQEPFGLRMDPTHLLGAEFHALTTTSGRGRTDTYLCSYHLIDIRDGQIVWEDTWEVKHAVRGVTYD